MIGWLLALMVGVIHVVPAALHAADSPATLAGAWTGHWTASESAAAGPVEVIITSDADRGPILAQFTFVHGARAVTSRRQGLAVDGGVRFEAPDDGEIVLRLEAPGRLVGDFSGTRTLPAPRGGIELTRTR